MQRNSLIIKILSSNADVELLPIINSFKTVNALPVMYSHEEQAPSNHDN